MSMNARKAQASQASDAVWNCWCDEENAPAVADLLPS